MGAAGADAGAMGTTDAAGEASLAPTVAQMVTKYALF